MAYRFISNEPEGGLERSTRVPFLLSDDMRYLDEPSRFLRERAAGIWRPEQRESSAYSARTRLSDNTLDAYSRDLENFWTYLETRKVRWQTLSYQHVLDFYDADMARGRWSEDGKPLSASTVNRRVEPRSPVPAMGCPKKPERCFRRRDQSGVEEGRSFASNW